MHGETAVVTGASRGIGAAVVREFADAGAHVVACARDADGLDDLAAAVEPTDGAVTTQRADVRDEFDVERLMEAAAREGGGIDIVVANAGVYHGPAGETSLASESYAAFDDHLRTNGRGTFTTIREALPHLSPHARLLVTSGGVAREAKPGYGSYAVSKATAEAIARGFAADLDHSVSVVDPGVVATELTGGTGRDPADVAPMFRWAATDAPADDLDGGVLDLKAWKRGTR
ncbi:SDR family oxidoreductase [Halorientalis sp.]|uniref:SDR family oxidoreductase n=1 Tax=Halorientalis sp. TaxID=1931229 RepID=UPI002617C0C6|nr:SDR family oxidoreductase [Halorientalis sp.]